MEKADKTVSPQTAVDLDTYFKTDGWDQDDGHFQRIYKTIRRAGRHRVLLPGFDAYLRHESKAIGVRCFAAQVVPGLLQTEDYARGTMDLSEPAETLDARTSGRINRQAILTGDKPPETIFVLDESVFRRPVGGHKTMVGQIDHLIGWAQSPHVQIRVMPFDRITPVALVGGLILLSFEREADLLYFETGSVGHLVDREDVVFKAGVHFITMVGEALSLAESIEFMSQARETYL
ncbi:Uncharacterised protein [Mycobacterium tuberculosis]|nr:Uncharacterised protein [Mycobacterium tuberculosis]